MPRLMSGAMTGDRRRACSGCRRLRCGIAVAVRLLPTPDQQQRPPPAARPAHLAPLLCCTSCGGRLTRACCCCCGRARHRVLAGASGGASAAAARCMHCCRWPPLTSADIAETLPRLLQRVEARQASGARAGLAVAWTVEHRNGLIVLSVPPPGRGRAAGLVLLAASVAAAPHPVSARLPAHAAHSKQHSLLQSTAVHPPQRSARAEAAAVQQQQQGRDVRGVTSSS